MLSSTTAVIGRSPYFVRTSLYSCAILGDMADWAMKSGLGKAVTLVSEFAPAWEAEETFANNYKAAGVKSAE